MPQREAPEIEAMMRRMLRALVRRAADGELEALEALANLQTQTNVALGRAVIEYRRGPAAASWTDIGVALGITRQTAHERFSGVDVS